MDIATRMKSYENDERLPKGAVIIRVDGKGFHTWTKAIKAKKPFDNVVHKCMLHATQKLASEIQGFKIAYTQSDESTFMLSNLEEKEGAWFDYKVQKLASVSASIFTNAFNDEYDFYCNFAGYAGVPALFDARAFSIPVEDAANNFVWRQQDWARNSVQMLGRAYISHKDMQGLNSQKVLNILKEKYAVDWHSLEDWERFGTFVVPDDVMFLTPSVPMNYDEINRMTTFDKYLEQMNDSHKNRD
jgi:tRNA(His) guanylyltransferase